MSPTRWMLGVLAIVAAGLAAGLWWAGRSAPAPVVEAPPQTPAPAAVLRDPASAVDAGTAGADATAGERVAAEPEPLDTGEARQRFAQGICGHVVDERGTPIPGAEAFLVESAANDPLALPSMLQQGLALGPTAATRTGEDGTFALGLDVATAKLYEVHCLAPGRADTRLAGLTVLAGQWHDLGAITMPRGAVVRGRVVVEGSDLPVPQAVVTLLAGTAFDDAVLRALPGREEGLTAAVDGNGFYEFANAPATGSVQLTAVAPGFAAAVQENVLLRPDRPVVVDFGLRPGHSLAGVLLDGGGRPVAGARVEAWPTQTNAPPRTARSRSDGGFAILGLQPGVHRLRVQARGYQDVDLPDLVPTRADLRIELRPRARVIVTVTTPDNAVLRQYRVGLRRWFPARQDAPADLPTTVPEAAAGHLGLVAEVPDQRVRLDGLTDAYELIGAPAGVFVCQVEAEGFAKSLSLPFRIEPDAREVTVGVLLSRGASVRGRVLDEVGRPLAGATVSTQAAGATPDNPLWRMLASATPAKITVRTTTTAADGSFVLAGLALGAYDLVVEHPDACRTLVRNLEWFESTDVDLPAVQLPRGAVVRGRATLGGKIAPQLKVLLTSAASAPEPSPAPAPVRLEAATDATGLYVMPRRIPPGTYELRGLAVAGADPQGQPIHQLLQMQRSARPCVVPPGVGEVVVDLDIPQQP